jgi:hypothetical protein
MMHQCVTGIFPTEEDPPPPIRRTPPNLVRRGGAAKKTKSRKVDRRFAYRPRLRLLQAGGAR